MNKSNPIYGGLNLREAKRLHYLEHIKVLDNDKLAELNTLKEKRTEYIHNLYWVYGVSYLPIPNFK